MKHTFVLALLCLFFHQSSAQTQQKSKLELILETSKSALDLLNSSKKTKQENVPVQENNNNAQKTNVSQSSSAQGSFTVKNMTDKRLTVKIRLINSSYTKEFVLSKADKEIFKNLALGNYSYEAKTEDGTVVKSGEFELTEAEQFFEKEIK